MYFKKGNKKTAKSHSQ